MKTSSCKAKGRRGASDVRDLILKYTPEIEPGDVTVVPSGVTGPDLLMSPKAVSYLPIVSEVKNQESLAIWKALEQAESHRMGPLTPVLWFRRNRSKLYVSLLAEDFMKLVMGE